MNIETLIDELIQREGGYANHPADRGGPTRWGVTEARRPIAPAPAPPHIARSKQAGSR